MTGARNGKSWRADDGLQRRSRMVVSAPAAPVDDRLRCDHVAVSGAGWTECVPCGSRCRRDRDGNIEVYQRGTADRPSWSKNDKLDTHGDA